MHLALVTHDLADNSLGRAYCFWLITEHLGWSLDVVAIGGSGKIWPPVRGMPFAQRCTRLPRAGYGGRADLVLALKPWPRTLDAAAGIASQLSAPMAIDIDDPDLEVALTHWRTSPVRTRWMLRGRAGSRSALHEAQTLAQTAAALVSNPALGSDYPGAVVVPHVRDPSVPQVAHVQRPRLRVAFVGTPRTHKGVEGLRRIVQRLGGRIELHLTAAPPRNPGVHEHWHGTTSLARGLELLSSMDVAVVPSVGGEGSDHQLPVKLIDAMMAGCAIVASDLAPIRWALGGTGVLIPAGDEQALASALRTVFDPGLRRLYGAAARDRATRLFTPVAVARDFERFVLRQVDGRTRLTY